MITLMAIIETNVRVTNNCVDNENDANCNIDDNSNGNKVRSNYCQYITSMIPAMAIMMIMIIVTIIEIIRIVIILLL